MSPYLALKRRRKTGKTFAALGVLLAALCAAAHAQANAGGSPSASILAFLQAPQLAPPSAKYVGPGSCSAVACHGGIEPKSVTRVLQNEYSTWVTQDKHARAYAALTEPLAAQMARTLKIGPAQKAQKCLACHAVSVDAAHRSPQFEVAEGVSCESCHGPASLWLGQHVLPDAKHAQMVSLGLVDNQSLTVRSEKCLTCHLGAQGVTVDHAMIAAGHPDLTFELDSFTAVEPPHWVEKAADQMAPLNDPFFGVRAWGIGEAVQLRESMLRVAWRAKEGPWPEFSEMDCIACHHSLTGPLSWRQQTGYSGHRPGDPPYNLARYVVFEHLANEVDAPLNKQLDAEVSKVAALVTSMSGDRTAVESAANRAADLAGKLLAEVREAKYDRARAARLMKSIASDSEAISRQGERAAEQATMTLDSLYIASAKDGAANAGTRLAIDGLFRQVSNPSAYNAPQFAAQMKSVRATLQ